MGFVSFFSIFNSSCSFSSIQDDRVTIITRSVKVKYYNPELHYCYNRDKAGQTQPRDAGVDCNLRKPLSNASCFANHTTCDVHAEGKTHGLPDTRKPRHMTVEYAPKGLIGVFTPQANTTVEPEMAILMPPGHAFITARMVSARPTISDRLVDYMDQFPGLLGQFANAPVDVVALACTGAAYLIGHEREAALLADITARTGAPALSGASAAVDALRMLGARRIGLVSPYDSALDRDSAAFWALQGFEVVAEASAFRETTSFHPIYSLSAAAANIALDTLKDVDADAILMLGTGMPTLATIAARPMVGRAPVLSCMLCLAWRAVACRDAGTATRDALMDWVHARHWRAMIDRGHVRT